MESLSIPLPFFDTYYDGSKYPGNSKLKGLKHGANCQYFVYEVLKHFKLSVPDFRSSDLWKDKEYTKNVKILKPLDILFFNKTKDPYGAHLGLYLGKDCILHLSKEVSYPTVWNFEQFKKRSRYKIFIGAKRVKV